MDNSTTIRPTGQITESPSQEEKVHNVEDIGYLLVPFVSVFVLIILTVIVIMLLQRKRKIDRLRHNLMPFYNFAPGEEEDWETELLESEGEGQSRRDYNSVSFPNYQQLQM